jgi:hypothetical protein
MASTATKTSETKKDTTDESFKPRPAEVLVDIICKKDGKMNITDRVRTINSTINDNNIFLESSLSFESELPIM